MRVVNFDKMPSAEGTVGAYLETLSCESPKTHTSYHELSETPVSQKDCLQQLSENLAVLNDLNERLAFVMSEVRYQLKA